MAILTISKINKRNIFSKSLFSFNFHKRIPVSIYPNSPIPLFPYFLISLFLFVLPFQSRADSGNFKLVSQNESSIILEWNAPALEWEHILVSGKKYAQPKMGNLVLTQREGLPQLPQDVFILPLSASQQVTISVLDSVVSHENCEPICPAPVYVPDQDGYSLSYQLDEISNSPDDPWPAQFLSYEQAISRGQGLLRISIIPLRHSPATLDLWRCRFMRIRINLIHAPSSLGKQKTALAQMDNWYNPLLDNIKIYLADDGVYQISGQNLQDQGIQISSINPQLLKIFLNGVQQPCQVTGDQDGRFDRKDQILFYGKRRQDDSSYFSSVSDTNVFWLTWYGNSGQRYSTVTPTVNQDSPGAVFAAQIHLEQDMDYHEGDTNADIQMTDMVPGEGWIWYFINRGEKKQIPFQLPGLSSVQDSLHLRMRLRGTTFDVKTIDHHARISINSKTIQDVFFNDREEKIVTASIPRSQVVEMNNVLEIYSVDDLGVERSQFYLDWIEFEYQRKTLAENHWLHLYSPSLNAKRFFASGFGSDAVSIWDTENLFAIQPELVGLLKQLHIEVKSAGNSAGNSADFLLDGLSVFYCTRGHNVVALDPETGVPIFKRTFDTWEYSSQADSLAAFINRLAPGTIVLDAIRDEGMKKMNEIAFAALGSVGSSLIRNVQVGESFALIGRKGAAIGTAIEASSPVYSGPAVVSSDMFFPKGGTQSAVVFSNDLMCKNYVIFDTTALRTPRLALDEPGHLKTGANGADYIMITHKNFMSQAQRLALHHEQKNKLRTRIVDVDDIYDEFNAGLKDPHSIKEFLQYCTLQWPRPAPQYVLLFGDASWDPKKNLADATAKDFVPTYGNPVSDTWFVCLDGENDLTPDMSIGRLPVSTPEEAQAVVDKIIAYETTPSAAWKKNFLFISGGLDYVEQPIFDRQSQYLAEKYIIPAPVCGSTVMLNKKSQGLEEGEHREDIIRTLDNGAVWTNFVGHAGSRTWDLMFHNPEIDALSNSPHYSFITSMTCHTGRFAEPNQVSFGEHFVNAAEKGAIAFWGTSGWGYVAEDFLFLQRLFPIALRDTVRQIGDAITKAKIAMWETYGSGEHIRNVIYQYTLMGDPAVKLAIPEQPDLTILPSDISIQPLIPSEADSIAHIQVRMRNFGLSTAPQDSVHIHLFADHPQQGRVRVDSERVLPSLALQDSLLFNWPLKNMAGSVELEAIVDPFDQIDEVDETNNSQKLQVTVLSSRLQVVAPLPFQLLPLEQVELKIQNPQQTPQNNLYFEFQLDTTVSFVSPFLQSSGVVAAGILITSWKPATVIPGTVHFWRCRNFSEQAQTAWITNSFRPVEENVYGWQQGQAEQFSSDKINNIIIGTGGVHLYQVPVHLYAESAGFADGNFARIVVNNEPVLKPERGHNVAVVDPGSGIVEFKGYFDTYASSAAADAMADLIESLKPGKYVLIGIQDEGTVSMTENAFKALESIGSKFCRQVSARDSWAIIGIKGAAIGSIAETLVRTGEGSAVALDTLTFFNPSGQIFSPPAGPTQKWINCNYLAEIPDSCSVALTILGHNQVTGQLDTLMNQIRDRMNIDLSAIDAGIYPSLSLIADLSTSSGFFSPVLKQWQVTFDPVCDLAVGPQVFSMSCDSLLIGESATINMQLYNIGQAVNDSVIIQFQELDATVGRRTFANQKIGPVPVNEFVAVQQSWTSGKPGVQQLFITLNPDKRSQELSFSNNTFSAHIFVRADSAGPQLRVTFDGHEIMNGDLVASQPLIALEIHDNSPQAISDTSLINVILDGKRIPFAQDGVKFTASTVAGVRGQLEFMPALDDGEHVMEFFVFDASKNLSTFHVNFRVIHGLNILNVMNYPNPFDQETHFVFELTQSARVIVKVFTIAGRLIRILDYGWLSAGYNSLLWDGKDGDGDILANGVYIYKIYAQQENEKAEQAGKGIVMR